MAKRSKVMCFFTDDGNLMNLARYNSIRFEAANNNDQRNGYVTASGEAVVADADVSRDEIHLRIHQLRRSSRNNQAASQKD
jgi:hypothetical protein